MKDRWTGAVDRIKATATGGDTFSRVRRATEQIMRESAATRLASIAADGSSWLRLAKSLVEAVGTASPMGLSAGADVLEALAGLQDEQTRLLISIESKVDLLREGPFLIGRDLVEEAARAAPERRHELLGEALPQFRQARRNAATAVERAVAQMHLGYVQFLLENRAEAEHWLRETHLELTGEAQRLVALIEDVRVLKSRKSTAFAAYMYPVGIVVIAKKFQKVRASESARVALVELQPALTGVSEALESLGAGSFESYEFFPGDDGVWTYQPLTIGAARHASPLPPPQLPPPPPPA